MKSIFIIIFFLCSSQSFTQDTIRPYYGGSEKLEEYPRTDKKQSIKIKSAWLPNGKPTIINGNGYREYEMWGEIRRYYYREGEANGIVMFLDTTKTIIRTIGYYYSDKKEGQWITFFDNGQISSTVTYFENKTVSDYKTFYKKGNLRSITEVDSNKTPNGNYIEYYQNNKKKMTGQYELVLCDFLQTDTNEFNFQNSEGRIKFKSIPVGNWTEYYPNGEIKEEMYYSNKCEFLIQVDTVNNHVWNSTLNVKTCPNGEWKSYNEKGVLLKTIIYRNCEMINEE